MQKIKKKIKTYVKQSHEYSNIRCFVTLVELTFEIKTVITVSEPTPTVKLHKPAVLMRKQCKLSKRLGYE